MKKTLLIIAVVLVCLVSVNHVFGGWVSDDLDRYVEVTKTNDVLPKLEELGEYESVDFRFYRNNMLIFRSDSYILKVAYDEKRYKRAKETVESRYRYQEEDVLNEGYDGIKYMIQPKFEIDTFQMKLLSLRDYEMIYPHRLVFVGTSDEKNMVSYVYYVDDDLDYIDCPFREFLRRECGWR